VLRSSPPFFQPYLSRRLRLLAGLGAIGLAALVPADSPALVANCEDGSVVLASRWEDVHCAGAVEVAPGETARLGEARRLDVPDWRKARRQHEAQRELDLETQIERAHTALRLERETRRQQRETLRPRRETLQQALPELEATRFELSKPEYDALSRFIELRQEFAVADIARGAAGPARMRLAHSQAFEAKLRVRLVAAGRDGAGIVLVFSLAPQGAQLGDPPHFAQRGSTFRPQSPDPAQLGRIIRKGAPEDEAGARLGYVVLPAGFELGRPLVLFWGDAIAVAQLLP
jgi:hypothetical protein